MPIAPAPDLDRLVRREPAGPHSILGAREYDGGVVVRAFRPAAANVAVVASGERTPLESVHPGGVFEGVVDGAELPLTYRLEVEYPDAGTVTIDDPYRFLPTVGELDVYLIGEGRPEEPWPRLRAALAHG